MIMLQDSRFYLNPMENVDFFFFSSESTRLSSNQSSMGYDSNISLVLQDFRSEIFYKISACVHYSVASLKPRQWSLL